MSLEPKNWNDLFYPAPEFDREAFQLKLDKICGLARGERKIRLVFGSEEEEDKESQISDLGMGLGVRKVGRYLTKHGTVRIRRWIFEEWQPPEILQTDQQFVMMPGSGFFVPPQLAQMAQKGSHELVYIVADHTRCNCAPEDFSCMGDYRDPDGRDLQNFRRMTAAVQNAQIEADPFAPASQDLISKLQQDANARTLQREHQEIAEREALLADRAATRKKHSVS